MSDIVALVAGFHIFFAVCWLGSAVFFAFVMGPILAKLSPSSRNQFFSLGLGTIEKFMLIVSTLTIIFGITLTILMGEFTNYIIFGASLAIIAYLIGLLVMTHLTHQILKNIQINENQDKMAEKMLSINRKFRAASTVELIFMILAFGGMVAAGFV